MDIMENQNGGDLNAENTSPLASCENLGGAPAVTPENRVVEAPSQSPKKSQPAAWLRSFQQHSASVLPGLILLAVAIALNWQLFTIPWVERGDLAVNALQVQNALHFRELLGNYSRWHFHHPGPFFFYLFAAGEAVFFRFLHIVPAPLNGEYLAEMIFSTSSLFLAIHLASIHVREKLFQPLAVLFSVIFIEVVNAAIPSSALASLWPPYMAAFCFLLMMVCCASIAAGHWKHLPILAFAAMVMVHSHVAQMLFVTVLCSASLGVTLIREFRHGRLPAMLRSHRRYLVASLAIVAVFLFPMVLEVAIHHPSNFDRILEYLHAHHGEHNSWRVSLLYLVSFFTYNTTPDTVLANPAARFRDLLNPAPFVASYWTAFLAAAWAALIAVALAKRGIALFVRYLLVEVAVVTLLFLYWSRRITGPMYTFNGYFFFVVQLLALFAIAACIANSIPWKLGPRLALALACGFAALSVLIDGLKIAEPSAPEVKRALHANTVELVIPMTTAMEIPGWGVASYLQRDRISFCLSPDWEFVFGPNHVCTPENENRRYTVQFSDNPTVCQKPCSVIYQEPQLYVTGTPPVFGSIPALIRASEPSHLQSGFNGIDRNGAWSEETGIIRFYLGAADRHADSHVLQTLGIGLPGRRAYVSFNGFALGLINRPARSIQTFSVPGSSIVWDGPNTVAFKVPDAGPVGNDYRKLGYFVEELLLQDKDSKAVVRPVSETLADRLVPGVTWQADGGWVPDGFFPGIGRLATGGMWGSWNHNDALTGRLTSRLFAPDPAGCVVVPVGHGPSVINQRMTVTAESGKLVADLPLHNDAGGWKLFEVHYDPTVGRIRINGEDEGTGWGQWLAAGDPRSCGN